MGNREKQKCSINGLVCTVCVRFIFPLSQGTSITELKVGLEFGRYKGPSVVELVDSLEAPVRLIARPLRLIIAEVMKTRTLGASALGGKLESGAVQIGTKVGIEHFTQRPHTMCQSFLRHYRYSRFSRSISEVIPAFYHFLPF